jgi:peptidoglycan/LPS O-acetylase OafA/YrhL
MTNVWLRKACHYIARYSYGIYLTHFVCIWFAFAELARLPLGLRWLVFVTTAGAAPVVLYHMVEAPMISLGHRIVNSLATAPREGLKLEQPPLPAAVAVVPSPRRLGPPRG